MPPTAQGRATLARLVVDQVGSRAGRSTTTWHGRRRRPRSALPGARTPLQPGRRWTGAGHAAHSCRATILNWWCSRCRQRWPFAAKSRICRKCSATCSTTPASGRRTASRSTPRIEQDRLVITRRRRRPGHRRRAARGHASPRRPGRQQVPGSGLGLAIVDDLARLYGGQVGAGRFAAGRLAGDPDAARRTISVSRF